jgi:hypothetical protein
LLKIMKNGVERTDNYFVLVVRVQNQFKQTEKSRIGL